MSNQVGEIWNQRYQGESFVYGKEPNDFLRESLDTLKNHQVKKILCLAEGEGRNAVYLATQGFDVTAVDASEVGLNKALQLAAQANVTIKTEVCDLKDYHIPKGEYDAIVSIWCHVPPALRFQLHQQVSQSLKTNGVFILEAYHPDQLNFKTGGPPVAELMMTTEGLAQELLGLNLEVCQHIQREVHEGTGHFGLSSVVQCIAIQKP